MTNTINNMTVITATASPRLCQSHASTFSSNGHVATTIMVAQIKEVRKGLKIQKLAAISAPMNRTARVILVTSREADTFLFVIGFLLCTLSLRLYSVHASPGFVDSEDITESRWFQRIPMASNIRRYRVNC